MLFEDISTSFYFCWILEDWKFCRASQAVFNFLIVFIFIYTELLFSTTNKLKTYVYITNKIILELNVRINSWDKKTSWRQKKKKKAQTVHIFCRKRRARIQQRPQVPGAKHRALGSWPWAAATVQVLNGSSGHGHSPSGSYTLAAVQVHKVFASSCGWSNFQQLWFLVTGFLSSWQTERGLLEQSWWVWREVFCGRLSLGLWKTTDPFRRADLVLLPLAARSGAETAQGNGRKLRRVGSWWVSGEGVLVLELFWRALGHRELNDSHSL